MNWIAIASINLTIAVSLGAFGAHGLKSIASAEQLTWWQTGTMYFFFHALGLLVVGVLAKHFNYSQAPAYLLQAGIIIFTSRYYYFLGQFVCDGIRCTKMVWSDNSDWRPIDDCWLDSLSNSSI